MSSKTLEGLFRATVASLDPEPMVGACLAGIEAESVTVLALGKAAVAMARGARAALGTRISTEVVVAPQIPVRSPSTWMASSHPQISHDSERAGRLLLDAASQARDHIVALISGGGSALAAVASPGLSFADKAELLLALGQQGATIAELNIVRSHLSAIKGGRLCAAAQVPMSTYVLSDVVGGSLATVASGPTLPDASTYLEALTVVEKWLGKRPNDKAVEHLRKGIAGDIGETLKEHRPGDQAILVAGVDESVKRCIEHAAGTTEAIVELGRGLTGTVHELCDEIMSTAVGPGLWIGAGEATITLPAEPGVGGRAQHLALLLARAIQGRSGIQALVAGTDGIDGNSAAAGAVVDGTTWERIRRSGTDPERALEICDSGSALRAVGAVLDTGPTGVNHADLMLLKID